MADSRRVAVAVAGVPYGPAVLLLGAGVALLIADHDRAAVMPSPEGFRIGVWSAFAIAAAVVADHQRTPWPSLVLAGGSLALAGTAEPVHHPVALLALGLGPVLALRSRAPDWGRALGVAGAALWAALLAVDLLAAPLPAGAGYVTGTMVAAVPAATAVLALAPATPRLDHTMVRAGLAGSATAVLSALYVAGVAALAAAGVPEHGTAAAVLTAIAAVLLVPAWQAARSAVLRRLYGSGRVRLDTAAGPAQMLDAVAAAVAEAVRSPSVAIVLPGRPGPPASAGDERLPLPHGGHLLVRARTPGESYRAADRRLLATLSPLVDAVAVAAVLRLRVAGAERAQQELFTMERDRLHRDLHDGLGPLLAGISMHIEAVRRIGGADVRRRLDAVSGLLSQCRTEVRRVTHDLRPDALEGATLSAAVTALARPGCTVAVSTAATGGAALAAYRIAAEAITNVSRHAAASTCTVDIHDEDDAVVVTVADDGVGIPAGVRPGTGLSSMRARAEALGGTFRLRAGGRGTTVIARIPR